MTVYLVEDETNIRELVLYTLRASGYEAEGFGEAGAFYAALKKKPPDLALLDIMLPGEDGLSILKTLRENPKTRCLPVIMITAKDSEFDKVVGLEGGADDYVTKPFGMMELVSRVKAVLRRSKPPEGTAPLKMGGIELRPGNYTALQGGKPLQLTLKEYELLHLLMENPDIVFTRDQLLEKVWGYHYEGETRTVDVHVRMLRGKLGEDAALLQTVRGVGYRMGAGHE